jgi:hypothetical protein
LRRGLNPAWAARLARAAGGERYIYQSLLSTEAALTPEAACEVVDAMLEAKTFTVSQYGLKEAAQRGAVPDSFAPSRFFAADPSMRKDLLLLAEVQLVARGDESLHRFTMGVLFGPYPAETRATAWWALHRWYARTEPRGEGPFKLAAAPLERFFGSGRAFAPKLAEVLRDPATLKEVGVFDFLAALLSGADDSASELLCSDAAAGEILVDAACAAVAGDYWPGLLSGLANLLGRVGANPLWRERVVAALSRADKSGEYQFQKALERLKDPPAPKSLSQYQSNLI